MPRIPISEKKCVDCGKKGVVERKRCLECAKEYNRQRAKKRYKEEGRFHFESTCPVCKKPMKAWRRDQIAHQGCRHKSVENYTDTFVKGGNTYKVRKLVKSWNINIPRYWCIHHVDENPLNNLKSNLWIMSMSAHNSLHRYLQNHRSLWLKDHNSISENCWNTLRAHLTTAWLEMTSAKVIKISEIGQSAGEPLKDLSNEEASETMHGMPKSD